MPLGMPSAPLKRPLPNSLLNGPQERPLPEMTSPGNLPDHPLLTLLVQRVDDLEAMVQELNLNLQRRNLDQPDPRVDPRLYGPTREVNEESRSTWPAVEQ